MKIYINDIEIQSQSLSSIHFFAIGYIVNRLYYVIFVTKRFCYQDLLCYKYNFFSKKNKT